ncbi:MAG: hypothetical protein JW904_05235 [Spirochaetales bacterium]|nr:hypothetical protein [Spirochaetales bacterium]
MKNYIFFLLLFISVMTGMYADEQHDIAEIHQLYTNVIHRAKSDGMYHAHITVNEEDHSWRALGTFAQDMDIYFDDSLKTEDGPLIYVKIAAKLSAGYRNEEYLFNADGNLVFVFYEDHYHEDVKHHIYLKNSAPFLYKKGDEEIRKNLDAEEFPLQWCIARGKRLYDFTFYVLMH